MGVRRRSRELALQRLFQLEFTSDQEVVKRNFWDGQPVSPEIESFANLLVKGVIDHLPEIDRMIEKKAEHWTPVRMSAVDRNILRVSVFELCYLREIPARVSINEAIEVAKKYGTEESGAFINGILDKILKEISDRP